MPINTVTGRTIYKSFPVSSNSFVYTANASTGDDDGWFSAKYNYVLAQIALGTLTATNLTYRIEGRFPTHSRIASLCSETLTGITSVDKIITVTEKVAEIRIGVKIDAVATPNNFHAGICRADEPR